MIRASLLRAARRERLEAASPRFLRRDCTPKEGCEGRHDVPVREDSRSGDQRIHRRARSRGRPDELAGRNWSGVLQMARNRSSRLIEASRGHRFFRSRCPRGADGVDRLARFLTDATIRPLVRAQMADRLIAASADGRGTRWNCRPPIWLRLSPAPTHHNASMRLPPGSQWLVPDLGELRISLDRALFRHFTARSHSRRRSLRFPWTR